MRKKIIYVITKSVWGGAQKYVWDIARNLPKDAFEVAVIAGGASGPLIQKLKEAGIKTFIARSLERDVHILKEFAVCIDLVRIFLREKPDIIHLNSSKIGAVGSVAGAFYKLLAHNRKPRIVFTVHGWAFNEDRARISKILITLSIYVSAFLQDKIILINTRDFEQAKQLRIARTKKLRLIFNGIEQSGIAHMTREDARKLLEKRTQTKFANSALIFGTISELTKNKGLVYLIQATKKLMETTQSHAFKVVIIGEGEEREKLMQLVKKEKLENIILFTYFIPEAARVIKGFDVFVLSSIKEGLPYVLMESMAAGCPVISTDVGGIPDMIIHEKNGILVPPKDSDALGEAMTNLVHNPQIRHHLSKEGAKTAKTKFDIRTMLEKTIRDVYA